MPRISAEQAGGQRVLAFLDMLSISEGTSTSKYTKDDGYDILVGGIKDAPGPFPKIFTDYSKHPNLKVTVNHAGLVSTAAGRYQALTGTWNECVAKYGFRGRFTPEAQDLFAVKKLTERGAMPFILAGNFAEAVKKCNKEWASLTGSPYGQNPHPIEFLIAAYKKSGGTLA